MITLDQFENKMDATAGGAESLGRISAQPHGGEDAFHRIGGGEMFPMLRWKIEETEAGVEIR